MLSRRLRCFDFRSMILVMLLCTAGLAQTTSPVPQIANPLVPTAVLPGSASFTLTINGTGFVSGSTVYWNGSPRTTTFVSAAQLTATITAADVATATSGTVTIHSPSGVISNASYLLVTNAVSLPSFGAAEINNVGTDSLSADLNGDGTPDVLVNLGNSILVALGNGDGSLQPPVQYSPTGNPRGQAGTTLADLNNDGFSDVAFPTFSPSAIQVMLNSGAAVFSSAPQLDLSTDTFLQDSTATADFNGDGKLDLVFTANNGVGVALGNGDGTFQSATYVPLSSDSCSITVGDFNRDGIPDIATTLCSGGVALLLGHGDGTFAPQVTYGTGFVYTLTSADLNGDGFPDLVGVDGNAISIDVLLNAGNGTFLPLVNYPGPSTHDSFGGFAVGDMNGDNKVDVVAQNESECTNNCIVMFLGNGDGTIQPGTSFGIRQDRTTGDSGQISLADFNHDGNLDIATPSANGPYLMVQTAAPAPTLVPGALSFASLAVGSESQPQTIQLFQPGSTAITVYGASVTGDFVIYQDLCANFVLGPGNSSPCNILVSFLPSTTGVRTGSLIITSSGGTQYAYLSGTGTAAINVSVTPSSINFGTVGLNSTSYTQWVYITNTGSQTLDLNSITLTGANPGDFLMTNPCGSTLAVGASCTVNVNFRPTMQGLRTGSVAVSDNAANSPQMVALSGTGNALHVSNNLLSFGNVTVGASSSLPLTFRNLGTKAILLSQIRFIANASDYSQTNDCNGRISARGSCTMTVTFTPQTQGQLNSVLSFSSNGSGTQAATSVTLRGRGQ
jgi:hypothetical protein